MPLHLAVASNTSVEVVRLVMDANPDASREKDKVWSDEGPHVYMQCCISIHHLLSRMRP